MIEKLAGTSVLYASPDDVTELREEDTAVESFNGWVVAVGTSTHLDLPLPLGGFDLAQPIGEEDEVENGEEANEEGAPTAEVAVPDFIRKPPAAPGAGGATPTQEPGGKALGAQALNGYRGMVSKASGLAGNAEVLRTGATTTPLEETPTQRVMVWDLARAAEASGERTPGNTAGQHVPYASTGFASQGGSTGSQTDALHNQVAGSLEINGVPLSQESQRGSEGGPRDRDSQQPEALDLGEVADSDGEGSDDGGRSFHRWVEGLDRAFDLSDVGDGTDLAGFNPVDSEPGLYEVQHPIFGLIRIRFEEQAGRRGLHVEVESQAAARAISSVQGDMRISLREQGFELISISAPDEPIQPPRQTGALELEA